MENKKYPPLLLSLPPGVVAVHNDMRPDCLTILDMVVLSVLCPSCLPVMSLQMITNNSQCY